MLYRSGTTTFSKCSQAQGDDVLACVVVHEAGAVAGVGDALVAQELRLAWVGAAWVGA